MRSYEPLRGEELHARLKLLTRTILFLLFLLLLCLAMSFKDGFVLGSQVLQDLL